MSSDRTTAKATPVVPKDGQDRKLKPPPPDHHVKCPRCDSPNTKFCYYNNYSLSQPRHFCKTCRRYWTKGGALRNVPIGGGCRKNKKMKQRLSGTLDPRDSSSCEIMGSIGGGHNFFQGFLTPAMDFQLGSINPPSISSSMFPANVVDTNFSLYEPHHNTSHLRSTTHHPSSNSVATLMSCGRDELAGTLQMGTNNNNNSMIVHSNLASSIESLSSINQELHWKLQQERLAAVLFPGDQSEKRSVQADMAQVDQHHQAFDHHHQPQGQTQKFLLQPILFQNLETTKEADHPYSTSESIMEGPEVPRKSNNGGGNNSATEWFLDANPYTNGRSNNNRGLNIDDQGNNTMNQQAGDDIHHNNWNTGIQAWSDMQQFSGALP